MTSHGKAGRFHGAGDLQDLFSDEAVLAAVPWEQAGRRRTHGDYDPGLLRDLLTRAPEVGQFAELDPRDLYATQPFVLRAGVAYYLTEEYSRSGRTYADRYKVGNKYPVVYLRDGQHLLLSGHHRAAAALLQGRPYPARLIKGPWGPPRGDGRVSLRRAPLPDVGPPGTVFVTPSLLMGNDDPGRVPHARCESAATAAAAIDAGTTAWLPFGEVAALATEVLRALGVEREWIEHQVHYARTGRTGGGGDPDLENIAHQGPPRRNGDRRRHGGGVC